MGRLCHLDRRFGRRFPGGRAFERSPSSGGACRQTARRSWQHHLAGSLTRELGIALAGTILAALWLLLVALGLAVFAAVLGPAAAALLFVLLTCSLALGLIRPLDQRAREPPAESPPGSPAARPKLRLVAG